MTTETFEPKIVAFVCKWCTYTGADLAGTSRTQYAPNVRIIKLPCTGRISPLFILKALEQGADGVLVSGCHPGDCHYTAGNYHARRKFTVFHKLLDFVGIERERVQFSWVSAAEGKKWAEVVDDVTAQVRRVGPRPASWGEPVENVDAILEGKQAGVAPVDPAALAAQTEELRKQARALLESGQAGVVIGYGAGSISGITRPVFITNPEDVGQLVWNEQCHANLTVYLNKDTVKKLGKPAVVVKGCDTRSLVGLLQENQLKREDVILLGMACNGVQENGAAPSKCAACETHTPALADFTIGEAGGVPGLLDPREDEIAQLERMSHAERWNFWQAQFDRCLRCYACRAACPMCSCDRCVADKTQPRWIPAPGDGPGNLSWHVVRAFHLAGRCADCGACSKACPANVRLDLLNRKMAQIVAEAFDYIPGRDPEAAPPLTMYQVDDGQEFIR